MFKAILVTAAIGAMCVGYPQAADATNLKSFISHSGSDANTCADATTNACATINGALAKTTAGGEITIVDPGDYGTAGGVKITKSITIDNGGGGEASVRITSGSLAAAITIEAGRGDVVILRGLTFEGDYTGVAGLVFASGLALQVENCVFRNWQGNSQSGGLGFAPTGNSQLFVSNSTFFNNGSGALSGGLAVSPNGTGSATVVLDHVHFDFNTEGLILVTQFATGGNGIRAVLRDSVASGNSGDGVSVQVLSGKPLAELFIVNSAMVNNTGNGVVADGLHATATLTGSTITRNGTGVSAINGGQIVSYGDNENNFNVGAEGSATSVVNKF